jgi:hypothetical protein
MDTFNAQELKDLLSAVVNDTRGTWGDQRSQRLDALHIKLERLVKEEAKQ